MRKIAVINDIHCNYYLLKRIFNFLANEHITDYIICGDSITDGVDNNIVLDELRKLNPIIIKGNREDEVINYNGRDWENNPQFAMMKYTYDTLTEENKNYIKSMPMNKIITIEDIKICISHGSPYYIRELVKSDDYSLFDKLIEDFNSDIYLFAHTHKAFYTKYKNKLFINVGALLPSCNKPSVTFGIIEIKNKEIWYSQINLKYNFSELKNYYLNSLMYKISPEWSNIIIYNYKTGIDYYNDFANYMKKQNDLTWKDGFKMYMQENGLDIY